jgi:para-nitrobenzyl esterase
MSGGIACNQVCATAQTRAGAIAFMPPMPVPKWSGVRDALDYGNIAPQILADRRRAYAI